MKGEETQHAFPHEGITIGDNSHKLIMEEVTDPEELAKIQARRARYERMLPGYRRMLQKCIRAIAGSVSVLLAGNYLSQTRPKRCSLWPQPPIQRTTGGFSITSPARRWPASMQINREWFLCDDGVARPG